MAGETYETDGPRCPYCGFLHTPDEPFYYDEDTTTLECGKCDREFAMRVYTSTSWSCEPLQEASDA
ncbi:hypothetical protein [Phenylobacterium sp.]|uniref:hypothetical protein n=1 Tax=Phenylobacterium sp. TaxID=1871053 RepID=UPI00198C12D4|nr:hypothetical protein [Phenylobacterium sp.]MBC7168765.1 hypothetical protein [Phenylobacterium sp.]